MSGPGKRKPAGRPFRPLHMALLATALLIPAASSSRSEGYGCGSTAW